ncbi:MAG: DNA topoisomerase IV subunit A [Bdellovibrionota bacterium]
MTVTDVSIREEARDRYLTYALSVVTGRALPSVQDGLKPVQRRILYAMIHDLKLRPNGSHRKSAKIVGEVLGSYHPHGDLACYEAMVRMAQDFSYRYPFVDGQGNFGSLDGDSAAAYRYTEAKLTEIALEVIGEINEETVHFIDNFDGTTTEPEVLPSRIPNLLMNGATGIAVGMATSIPPHNLNDLIAALIELLEDPDLSSTRLTTIVKGPDFPTGCLILNSKKELNDMYLSGRGSVRMRGEWKLENAARGKRLCVITSIPYALNKSQLVEKIANLIISKKVPQLLDVRDESTDVVRIVLELSSDADPDTAMAYLFKNTPLESNFSVNLTALVPTEAGAAPRPELLSLKDMLQYFLDFRKDVTRRKLEFEKRQLEERVHILAGLAKIFDKLDEAIKIVRQSTGRSDAATKLQKRFKLSEIQSFAVVDMRIYQLSKTNIAEIKQELKDKQARIKEIEGLLKSKKKIAALIKQDLENIGKTYGDVRRCKIQKDNFEVEINAADYVVQEDVYAIITKDGWVKRIRQTNELKSTRTREGDSILRAHPASTLDIVIFITSHGYVYSLNVIDFPSSSGYGDPIQKLLKFRDGERVVESFVLSSPDSQQELIEGYSYTINEGDNIILVSEKGTGFSFKLEGLESIKRNGKRALKPRSGDALAAVTFPDKKTAFFTNKGYGLQIKGSEIPERSTAAVGVSLIGTRAGDKVVSAISYDKVCKLKLLLDNGKEKEISSADVVSGKRALKGNKVTPKGEIKSVYKL